MTTAHAAGSAGIVEQAGVHVRVYLDVCIALCILQQLQENVSALARPAALGACSMVALSLQEEEATHSGTHPQSSTVHWYMQSFYCVSTHPTSGNGC